MAPTMKLDSKRGPSQQQATALQVVDLRTDNQRRNRKRHDTHQIHQGAAREIAAQYPRWTPSSEQVANRAEVTRLAVVDCAMAQLERRVMALELRQGPQSERLVTVAEWRKRA